MLLNAFKKKVGKDNNNSEEQSTKTCENIEKSIIVEKPKIDKETQQFIDIGADIKEDVKKISRGFFKTKNEKKALAYKKFESFLSTFDEKEIRRIKNLKYISFKEHEESLTNIFKNGFAQYLTKGGHIDENQREIMNFIFSDFKKLPSKAHRYWYFKTYIWTKGLD